MVGTIDLVSCRRAIEGVYRNSDEVTEECRGRKVLLHIA